MTREEFKKYIKSQTDDDLYTLLRKIFIDTGKSNSKVWKSEFLMLECEKRDPNIYQKAMNDSFAALSRIENGELEKAPNIIRIDRFSMNYSEDIEAQGSDNVFTCMYNGESIPELNINSNDMLIIDNMSYPYEGATLAYYLNKEFTVSVLHKDEEGLYIKIQKENYNPDSDIFELIGIVKQVVRQA